jgi:hypothetical protein
MAQRGAGLIVGVDEEGRRPRIARPTHRAMIADAAAAHAGLQVRA